MRIFLRQLRPAFMIVVVFTFICGVAYPLLSTAIGETAFSDQADGSLVRRDGVVIGSELIGQIFTAPQYFHGRPSSAGAGYDGAASSGSNLGPLNTDLLSAVADRAETYRQENDLPTDALVPVDAVTGSGSGLDPHISVANARLQAPRVAEARGMTLDDVLAAVGACTDDRAFAVLGEPGVNVVRLNVSLDDLRS